MSRTPLLLGLLVLSFTTPHLAAQPAMPPPPAEYTVRIRYKIDAYRNERIPKFRAMMRALEAAGFQRHIPDPDNDTAPADRFADRMTGTAPSNGDRRTLLAKLLAAPFVEAVMLLPKGVNLPADPDQRIRVHLDLAGNLPLQRQRILADQVRTVLGEIGFQEAGFYDHRGQRRLVGSIPMVYLNLLLNDLREDAFGEDMPAPFASVDPVRAVEVFPGMELPVPRPESPKVPVELEKLTVDLRQLAGMDPPPAQPERMEVILAATPALDDRTWKNGLLDTGVVIEGNVGAVVTVYGPPKLALAIAELPWVAAVRLARSGQPRLRRGGDAQGEIGAALKASGLQHLHSIGHRGRGQRVVVLDGDFRGWEVLRDKLPPGRVNLYDLTRERNRDFRPDSYENYPGGPDAVGHGTEVARAVLLGAPEAGLELVRIDPAALYQVQMIARAINGESIRSDALDQRLSDFEDTAGLIRLRRDKLLQDRRRAFDDLISDEEEVRERLRRLRWREGEIDQDEWYYLWQLEQYLYLTRGLRGLKGVRVVCSPLSWPEGHPADGTSLLSRYLDERAFRAAIWFQSAGNTRGQAWSGLFRDADDNEVMEFAEVPKGETAESPPPPEGHRKYEINYLAWQPEAGGTVAELPAGARLRVAIQWREAHDPTFLRRGEDLYRTPLFQPRLVLLRQRDPAAARLPADEMEVVAESAGLPQRLDHAPGYGTYEHLVELTVPAAGRYALRIEGRAPVGTKPASVLGRLPATEKAGELQPRIFVNTLAGDGRAVWQDHRTDAGSVSMPADSRGVLTVGAAGLGNRAQPYSAAGPAHTLDLLAKPEVLAFDQLGFEENGPAHGTSMATGFAAGFAATTLSSGGTSVSYFLRDLQATPGSVLMLRRTWPARAP